MTDEIQEAKDWLKSVRALGLKQEIIGALDTLERGLNALEKKPAPENPDPLERSVPEREERYFLVDADGDAIESTWFCDKVDGFRLATGNCYRTREQAEKVEAMLRRIIELRGDFRPDLDTPYQELSYVGYHRADKKWYCFDTNLPSIGDIFFPTQEAGETLIKEFGDDLFLLVGRI